LPATQCCRAVATLQGSRRCNDVRAGDRRTSGERAGSGGATATRRDATAPAVAPLKVRPFIMPQRRVVILAICGGDAPKLCAGVPPGGRRILECLAAHAAGLSPECYAAIARVSEK
jgi:hypothetical protein